MGALCSVGAMAQTRVACIGNSITYGMTIDDREHQCYPAQLQRMLGSDYEVGNFGHSGSTLLNHGHRPYMSLPEWTQAKQFKPDIAVVHLGINDTDPRDWPDHADDFVGDYLSMIDTLRQINPQVKIYIARLTPIVAKHHRYRSGTHQWRLEVTRAIENVAKASGATLIDFEAPLRDRQNLLPDGVHPNAEGAGLLAQTVYKALTGQYGPLSLSPVYTSGMVLQRNKPLHINGIANAFAPITLTLDGQTYRTTANGWGQWTVTTAPLLTGPIYTMTVTDGRDTIQLTDLLAGELWLASGQSNMEFTLGAAVTSEGVNSQTAAAKRDYASIPAYTSNPIRILDLKASAVTNNVEWSDSLRREVNRLNYFKPAQWQTLDTVNGRRFSAVAYHFGRVLRDSLQVPVGIICNAVGGSPVESWIDVNTLEANMPEILVNWRKNDYVQPWAQGRANKNAPGAGDRHPYEPSYLYSAGMRPMGAVDLAGVIWYQGESNAHNTMLWERLFPLFVQSWRNHFNNPQLPFYSVQLSSMDRPSWAQFRDAQRRVADSLDNVYSVVSHDHGNRKDVHPTNKRPVGDRLAAQALNHTYGMADVVPCGPEVTDARAYGRFIVLNLRNGQGLHWGRQRHATEAFEIAEIDGVWRPATVILTSDSSISLSAEGVSKPRYVRFAWRPYTEVQLMNEAGYPMSTFKMEVSNAADYDSEAGYEHGVSAPFAGMLGGKPVVIGGANFPNDPLGAKSAKQLYRGIYTPDGQRLGSMPQGMAYGATVQLPDQLLLLGGSTAAGASNKVYTVSCDDRQMVVDEQPWSLPATFDNMAAAAIGSKVYVAGGNVNGKPSRQLWMLDLNNPDAGWRRLRDLPGNPRTQPVMVAAKDAKGNDVLYLWGGFAPRHDGKAPTLNTDGLCYNPATNKWTALAAPTADGQAVSLGGAAATLLPDGRIAVAGGVNKDVFLQALTAQVPDYLMHPAEWYRFNPNVMVYDPATGSWSVMTATPAAARAGAALLSTPDGLLLLGGEIKPRIRTAQPLHL